jgi:ribosomal protein L11 methyltransferase
MEYKKAVFTLDPDSELNREILIAKLGEIGFDSFTENDQSIEAFIPSKLFAIEMIPQSSFSDYPFFTYHFELETIPNQNWNEVWEKNYFKPLQIGEECLIRAPFHTDFPKVRYEIIIDPKMAFGTGNHETTALIISEILSLNLVDKRILDMGCGTGVLAILASMKGAKEIVAIDIDENACNNTIENMHYNGIKNIEVRLGGADKLKAEQFDFIFANIQRNILLHDLTEYVKVMSGKATIIMSGFYLEDLSLIKERAEKSGLVLQSYKEKNNWTAATFKQE